MRAPSHKRPVELGRFLFGVAHYPEHETPAERAEDAALMRRCGFDVVRMAEFAWDRIEPEPGTFDFALFDETIAALGEAGIDTILCTPTATPPRWFTVAHPDAVRVHRNGTPQRHGSRQHVSLAHPAFRKQSQRITRVMAEHYRDNPHVIGWQTDNELNTQFLHDASEAATASFREFLRDRYGSIDALNEAWGTAFWALTYRSFDEIEIPVDMRPAAANPSARLDELRFLEDLTASFQHEQVVILRAVNPAWFVYHNVGVAHGADFRGRFGADLDVLGYDLYPFLHDFDPETRDRTQRRTLDEARAWTGNVIVPEQQAGPGGWPAFETDRPEPGEIRRMAWLSVAGGADGLMFFRWRSARFGAEMHWHGIVDHAGRVDWRVEELAGLRAEIDQVAPYLGGTWVHVDAAVAGADVTNVDAHATFSLGLPSPTEVGRGVHDELVARGWQAGFVHPADDLTDVVLYVLPHWAVIDPSWVPMLEAWVRDGGTLVVGARCGTRDERNQTLGVPPPGPLADLCAVTVTEAGRQHAPHRRPLALTFEHSGANVVSKHWYERLEPRSSAHASCEVLATWTSRHLAGAPAITRRPLGDGAVVTVGTYLERDVLGPLLDVLGLAAPHPSVPAGVTRLIRRRDRDRLWMLLNGSDREITVEVPAGATALVGPATSGDRVTLGPNAVFVASVAS